ncbi:MAG: hypothetical protein QM741_09325 [Rudaea sp.]|uniref:TOBE domain-containing protein n=1 Tax=Rudaea sp. TaxID=2136325 RepID=UPI0039E6CFE1
MQRPILAVCLFAFAASASAQASHPCAQVAQPQARLACYDKAFPPPREVNEAAVKQAAADFGLNKPVEPLRNPDQSVAEVTPDRIESKVADVDWLGGSSVRSITLENGQVWVQTQAANASVRVGDTVRLSKGMLGSYFLTTQAGVKLRVRRTH